MGNKKKAGFWQLMGAYAFDTIILFMLSSFTTFPVAVVLASSDSFTLVPMLGISFFVYLFYFTFMERNSTKASLGKLITGICLQAKSLTCWRILFSYLIDGIIITIIYCCSIAESSGDAVGDAMGHLFGPVFIFPSYFVICEYLFGKTLGKSVMGITVVQKEILK